MTPDRDGANAFLEARVEAYEHAHAAGGRADLADFLPPPEHPLYEVVLVELVRLDLEYGWARGQPTSLEEYRRRFPRLFSDLRLLRDVAFEEYRLRLQAGQHASVSEYQKAYGVNVADRPGLPGHTPGPFSAAHDFRPPSVQTDAPPDRHFRLQPTAGEAGALESVPASAGLGEEGPELLGDLRCSDPQTAARLVGLATTMPEPGSDFLDFQVVAELGRGAFGRIFLARQGDLANRYVVLKVSAELFGESQTLAQLQHTNIVPIYSAHRAGALQVLCMPYLGSTTLASVCASLQGGASLPASGQYLVQTLRSGKGPPAREEPRPPQPGHEPLQPAQTPASQPAALETLGRLSYVKAILWLGARVADGLAHAHERGILHRDLKPANVLLTDDGQPMLLDFNLAEDTKLRSTPAGARVGGTLPYMAPELLEAFRAGSPVRDRTPDGRSDLYSLGTILFELLTGRLPFGLLREPTPELVQRMLEQRRQPPPRLRPSNPAVSCATEAIVRRCLEPDPQRRYPSARALAEDLDRHLADLPLRHIPEPSLRERARKWLRRHPRLSSATTVGAVAAVLILTLAGALVGLRRQKEVAGARSAREQFCADKLTADFYLGTRDPDQTRLDEGIRRTHAALSRYRVLEDDRWLDSPVVGRLPAAEQGRLREDVADLLWTLARATALLAERSPEPGRRELLARALALNRRAEQTFPAGRTSKAIWTQRAHLAELLGQEEAGELRLEAERMPAQTARDHFLLGLELADRGQVRKAAPLLRSAVRELVQSLDREPWNLWGWFLRGNCHDLLHQDREAATCYTVCVALDPRCYEAYFNRGLVSFRERRWQDACADLGRAIDLRPDLPWAHFQRALAQKERGDYAAAERDLSRALALGLPETRAYFLRAEVRERRGDVQGARRDRTEGLRRRPVDEHSWLERGITRLGMKDSQGALADFANARKVNPRYLPAWQNTAHVLAELGRNDEALKAMQQAVSLYPDFVPARLGRGVLLARLGKREQAHRDARAALDRDASPRTLYQAANIYALTSRQNSEDRLDAFPLLKRALAGGFGLDVIDRDPDMDPIRNDPAFVRIVKAARDLRPEPG
jgi:serine/threonine protein kinase/tetratricopeptide (TPR) repeat protein